MSSPDCTPFPCDGGRRAARLRLSVCFGDLASRGGRTRPFAGLQHRPLRQRLCEIAMDGVARSPRRRAPCEPIALSRSRCGRRRPSVFLVVSAEVRPNTSPRRRRARTARARAFSAAGSRGNLWPSSMPVEAGLLRLGRQVSSGISPPSSRMSSLDQPMGLAPIRIVIVERSFASAQVLSRSLLPRVHPHSACAPPSHLCAVRHSGTATSHQCPPASVEPQRIGVDDETVVRSALRARSSAASRSAMPSTFSAIAPRLRACAAKVDRRQSLMPRVARRLLKHAPPVALCRRLMQPKPRLSSTTMVSFSAEHDRGRDLRVHHQIGAVADHDEDLAVGLRQLHAEAAGDLVAHAGDSRIRDDSRAGLRGLPELVQFARQAAGRAARDVGWPHARCTAPMTCASDGSSALVAAVARSAAGSSAPCAARASAVHALGARQPASASPRAPRARARRRRPGAVRRACRRRRPARSGRRAPFGVLEQRAGARGEVLQPRADGEDDVGLGGQRVGGARCR